MRMAKAVLKRTHEAQKVRLQMVLVGRRMQLRKRGIVGSKKRGSWCGKRLRSRVPVVAEARRALLSVALRIRRLKG
jgi:hypothetical protein